MTTQCTTPGYISKGRADDVSRRCPDLDLRGLAVLVLLPRRLGHIAGLAAEIEDQGLGALALPLGSEDRAHFCRRELTRGPYRRHPDPGGSQRIERLPLAH